MSRPTSVRISDDVWRAWEASVERGDEPTIRLLLRTGDPAGALEPLRESVLEVQQRVRDQHRSSPDPPFPGEFDWARDPAGVLVQITECDDLRTVLPALAAALGRRGVRATIGVHRARPVTRLPPFAHLLECRMRVRGARRRRGPRAYVWQPDPAAHAALLDAACEWVAGRDAPAPPVLRSGTLDPQPVAGMAALSTGLRAALAADQHAAAWAGAADDLRAVGVRAHVGGVSLLIASPALETEAWRDALSELGVFMRRQAGRVVHGAIRRGWDVTNAILSPADGHDWPRRPGARPKGAGFTSEAFDDELAPDAFGVQLLGPRFAGRLAAGGEWRVTPVAEGRLLLEHADPAAWFAAPFVPLRSRVAVAPPDVLVRARAALAALLYTPGALHRAGIVEEPEL